MDKTILLCLADGSEETEAVTTSDLLVRARIHVRAASVNDDGGLTIVGSRGVRLLADAPLAALAEEPFDAIVLPGGVPSAFSAVRCCWSACAECTSTASWWRRSAPRRLWY